MWKTNPGTLQGRPENNQEALAGTSSGEKGEQHGHLGLRYSREGREKHLCN